MRNYLSHFNSLCYDGRKSRARITNDGDFLLISFEEVSDFSVSVWIEIPFSILGSGLPAINCSPHHVKSRWCMRLETISQWLNRKANHKRQNTIRYRKIMCCNDYTGKWKTHSFCEIVFGG
ncbi:hypothetical protein AVEN_238381-1 [Araneus ventricosus]|uniref:Uncharacterized protein n=1 Tax=Araneus ventricosus TaxID=182803 RepID=A0A4Y2DP65_ARAVE|nr:hypothetical protein AVEN_238381-1 [Araneus ventricosus]